MSILSRRTFSALALSALGSRCFAQARETRVVLLLTGHTLKDPEYTLENAKPAVAMDADPDAVIRMLEAHES